MASPISTHLRYRAERSSLKKASAKSIGTSMSHSPWISKVGEVISDGR